MQPIEISEPGKYLLINLHTEDFPLKKYTYFIAGKNNERFVGHHPRLFFLVEDKSPTNIKEFGYARELPKNQTIPFKDEGNIPNRKMSLLVEHIKEIKYDQKQSVEIQFTYKGKNTNWDLKLENQRMAENVYHLLQNAKIEMVQVVNSDQFHIPQKQLVPMNSQSLPVENNLPNKTQSTHQDKPPADGVLDKQVGMAVVPSDPLSINNPGANLQALVVQEILKGGQQLEKETGIPPIAFTPSVRNSKAQKQRPEDPLPSASVAYMPEQKDEVAGYSEQKEKFIRKTQQNRDKQEGVANLSSLKGNRQAPFVSKQSMKGFVSKLKQRLNVINNQNQIWNYEFLKGNQETLIPQFKRFSQSLVAQLVDQLCLPESQRLNRPISSSPTTSDYLAQGLNIRLCFTDISEIKLVNTNKQTICDQKSIKEASREFKNMDYLLGITRNKGRVRLPLATIVQYKGVVAFVRAEIQADQREPVSLSNQLEIISAEARINKNIFVNPSGLKILPLMSKKYQKLARGESTSGRAQGMFDIYYLNDIKHFLPADFNFVDKDLVNKLIRPELLQKEEMEGMQLMGQDITPYLNRIKTERTIQESISELQDSSRRIIEATDELLGEWEGMEEVTLTSSEVQSLLHRYGVNMRYLGMLCDKTSVPLIRKICMSEVAARAARTVLRAKMQDVIRAYSDDINSKDSDRMDRASLIGQCDQYLTTLAIDFLNGVASESPQSETLWKKMSKQSQYTFNIPVSKTQILEGYFVQALVHHCNVQLDWSKFPSEFQLFRGKLFKKDMVTGLGTKSKNYNLDFTDLYNRINSLIKDFSPENSEQVKSLLNLRKLNIPDHFRLNGTYNKLVLLLSTYIQPHSQDKSANVLPCTSLYELVHQDPPSYTSMQIGLMEIKWALKEDNIKKAQRLYKVISDKLTQWCGDIHPVYTQLYSIFAQYHLLKGKFEQASKFSRSALANEIKLLGDSHHKIAQRYYELADIGFRGSRKEDSLANYRKAMNICNNTDQKQTIPYADIKFKVGLLSLQSNKLEDAQSACRDAVQIYERNREDSGEYQRQCVECYQLLLRIYQVWGKNDDMEKISFYCGENIDEIKQLANLETAIKVLLIPYFLGLKRSQAEKMLSLFRQIPMQSNMGLYASAYSFIKKLIDSQRLVHTLQQFFDNFNQISNQAIGNSILTRWRGFQHESKSSVHQYLSLVEALIYFLGQGFMMGSLDNR